MLGCNVEMLCHRRNVGKAAAAGAWVAVAQKKYVFSSSLVFIHYFKDYMFSIDK